MHASKKIILFEHASFLESYYLLHLYNVVLGNILFQKDFFIQVRCLCRIRSVFLCVGGIILFFLLMICPGCLQSGVCYKKTTFQNNSVMQQNIITLPPSKQSLGAYTLYESPYTSVSSSVCLSVQSCSVQICFIKEVFIPHKDCL